MKHLKPYNESREVSPHDVEEICYELTDLGYGFKMVGVDVGNDILTAVLIDKRKKLKYQEVEDTLFRLIDFLDKNLISIAIKSELSGWEIFYRIENDKKTFSYIDAKSYDLSSLEKVDRNLNIEFINIKFHSRVE